MCPKQLDSAEYAAEQLQKKEATCTAAEAVRLYASRPFKLRGARLTSTRVERAHVIRQAHFSSAKLSDICCFSLIRSRSGIFQTEAET